MTGQLWVVRAGEQARFVSEFHSGGYVAVGFREVATDDLLAVSPDGLKARATSNAEKHAAGQLINLAFNVQVDDVVIVRGCRSAGTTWSAESRGHTGTSALITHPGITSGLCSGWELSTGKR